MKLNKFKILFFCLISIIVLTKGEKAIIEVWDSKQKIDSYYTKFIYESVAKDNFNVEDILSLTGKICFTNSTASVMDDCFTKFENFNYQWIILANNSDYLKSLYEFKTKLKVDDPWKIIAIIINNDTITMNPIDTDQITPLYSVNNEIFEALTKYNITNFEDNFFINLFYSKLDSLEQILITFYLTIGLFGIVLIITVLWHIYTCKIYENYSTPLQKGFTALIYLRLILCALSIYFVYLSMKSLSIENMGDNLMRVYVETIVNTLNAVLQTMIWFSVLIIAYGWQIHRAMLTRNELRNLVVAFILLYLLICFDQIIDMIIDVNIWKFKPSDLKNFLLFTFMTFLTCRYCDKSKKIIKRRCVYALNFSREYFPSLRMKLSMLTLHQVATIIYIILYIGAILINRIIIVGLISSQFQMIIIYYINTIGLIFYLIIYHPRKFPNYFTVFYDDLVDQDFENNFNIFRATLNFLNSLLNRNDKTSFSVPISEEKLTKQEINQINTDNSVPIIIINPISQNSNSNTNSLVRTNDNLMNYLCIGIRNPGN